MSTTRWGGVDNAAMEIVIHIAVCRIHRQLHGMHCLTSHAINGGQPTVLLVLTMRSLQDTAGGGICTLWTVAVKSG